MVKVITRLGLILMERERREQMLAELIEGKTLRGDKVAALIDECKSQCYEFSFRDSEAVGESEKVRIRWMFSRIDGKKAVKNMNPDELAEWVLDMRKNGTAFSAEDLGKVARAMMGMDNSSRV